MKVRPTLALLVLVIGLLPGTLAAGETPAADASDRSSDEYYELLTLFVDTLDQVDRNYVKDISRRELLEAAIEGMLGKLDQHSDYISPDDLDRFKSGVESEFGGIGIQVSRQRDGLTVVSPLVNSPAYRAGLMAGDVITHIRGEPADDLTLEEAVKKMKGPVGTTVEITVQHPRGGSSETVTLTREVVRLETVMGHNRESDDTWDFMLDDEKKLGYLRVNSFARHTVKDLKDALESLSDEELQALILDLRFNPGGLLSAAIQVSDLFIEEGRIVSTKGRNIQPQTWDAHKRGTFLGFPMVVLVNKYSASASEIVAACLQDHKRAVVIGERTFGKGSVQNIIELENGRSALKLTTAGYQRPSGKNIHRYQDDDEEDEWGVLPDDGFQVELNEGDLRRLLRLRQHEDVARRGVEDEPSDESEDEFVDVALQRAIDYLMEKLGETSEVAVKTEES